VFVFLSPLTGRRRPIDRIAILPLVAELRSQFRKQLELLEERVIELFLMVSEDMDLATDALVTGKVDLLRIVSGREKTMDAIYGELEQLVDEQIALQAPVAGDLRLLLSLLRILPELERSHDLVVQIAELATHTLSENLSSRSRGLVRQMGDTGCAMWQQAQMAWTQRDATAAELVEARDQEIDSLHASLMAELASGVMTLPVTMDMTLVARFYERLGAHARNIARRVPYLAGR
jgi:phosphate transport system protein